MDADVIRPAASSVETRKRKGGEDSDEDSDEEAEAPSGLDEDDGDASDEDTTLGTYACFYACVCVCPGVRACTFVGKERSVQSQVRRCG
jgi:hypothetical protein